MLGVNILKEFDALPILETSVDNGSEENCVLWLNDVFAGVSLDDMICADANITYYVSGYVDKSISLQVMILFQSTTTCQMSTNSCLKT